MYESIYLAVKLHRGGVKYPPGPGGSRVGGGGVHVDFSCGGAHGGGGGG